jgi:hypothetical protein
VEVLGGSAPYSYMWSNGATTATVEGIAPGEYAVSITDANGCSTTLEQLLVDAPDAINGEVLAESAVAANEPIFFASSAAPELAHGWDFGDGISSSEAAPQHVYSIPGEYTVTLTLSDGACSRTVQHVVSVFVTTGVQDVDSNGLRAWSTGTAIVLVNEASQAGDVHVYDSAGHLVATSRLAAGTERLEVPTADWPTGIYRLAVTSATDRWTIVRPRDPVDPEQNSRPGAVPHTVGRPLLFGRHFQLSIIGSVPDGRHMGSIHWYNTRNSSPFRDGIWVDPEGRHMGSIRQPSPPHSQSDMYRTR